MFHEAIQMVHTQQRMKSKSLNNNNNNNNNRNMSKIGNSTNTIRKVNSQPIMFGSSVAIHKLRESKWFNHNEDKILCSVVENGFILEKKFKDDNLDNEWGIAIWKPGFGK